MTPEEIERNSQVEIERVRMIIKGQGWAVVAVDTRGAMMSLVVEKRKPE